MKSIIKNLAFMACTAVAAFGFQSCVYEEPFGADCDGALRMKMVIDSDLTRAETDNIDLGSSTVLYISNSKGLVRKYQGQHNIPDRIPLRAGTYLAEAWAGDSVPASFDKKFYQGQSQFEINGGDTDVTLHCGIANVVASINKASVDAVNVSDFKVVIGHSKGSLEFTADNIDAKGYFMMPNADKDLAYTISGVSADGKDFSVTGEIPGVKKGHEYILNVSDNPTYDEIGGAFILVTVDDREILIESEVTILGRPAVKGVGFDVEKQIFAEPGQFADKSIQVKAFGGLKNLFIRSEQAEALGLPSADIDLLNIADHIAVELRSAGIDWEVIPNEAKNIVTAYVHLKAAWLNALAKGAYEFTLTPYDAYGKSSPSKVRIGVGEGSQVIDDPVVLDPVAQDNLLNLRARKVVLTGKIIDATDTPSLEYREAGTTTWTPVSLESVVRMRLRNPQKAAGQGFKATVSGLKPGTRYEYRAVAGAYVSESMFFTTESVFTIPNAGFEDWGTYSAKTLLGTKTVIFPGLGSEPTYWDSGNEGAATANKVLTDKSADMFNSGSFSARLASASAMGVLAAGNVFTGDYVKTDGTNGVLSLGREYNGSHPDKVAVWANYRPGTVGIIKSGNEGFLPDNFKGQLDHCQIYAALTTAPIEIRTNPKNRKLFPVKSGDEDYDKVIAYGQITWTDAFGPDGALERVEIPLVYNDRAASDKPLYLVIVVSASKYGDYFSGSENSVVYLDDFELLYE